MRSILIALSLCILLNSCKTHQEQDVSLFRQHNWWERRMDRLEMWNLHHGYVLEKTVTVVQNTLIVTGVVAAIAGYLYFGGGSNLPRNGDSYSGQYP